MTCAILVILAMALVLTCIQTRTWPISLLIRFGLLWQATWLWVTLYAWPAVLRERRWYGECFHEAHKRMVETVPPAPTREPVAAETFDLAPGSARPGLWERLRKWAEA